MEVVMLTGEVVDVEGNSNVSKFGRLAGIDPAGGFLRSGSTVGRHSERESGECPGFSRVFRPAGSMPVRLIAKTSTTTVADKHTGKVVGKP
jgi:hypothetical protein